MPLAFVNTILGPYLVQAIKSDESGALRRIAHQSARLTFYASLPLGLILLQFGDVLIGWTFGAPYDALSYQPMAVLIWAQIVSVVLGNGGMLLAMGGYERQVLIGQLFSLSVILFLGWILIEPYGALGAAVAAGTGLVVTKTYFFVTVRRYYGISSGII
jgi:O-antigen/teichoic acid export membrane protein